ncbi:MAG: HlyD family secretion protein [Pseudomonadota bacterium]
MNPTPEKKKKLFRERSKQERFTLIAAGPVLLFLVGALFYLWGERFVGTDNAYIKSDKVLIAAEVSGRVTAISVKDNDRVKVGQVLFQIDKAPYEIAFAQADANLAAVKSDVEAQRATYQARIADLKSAEDNVRYQQGEYNRYAQLVKTGAGAKQRLDEAQHDRDTAVSSANAAKQAVAAVLSQLGGNPDEPLEQNARYRQAKALLDKVRLDLDRTDVKAPIDGVVANVNAVVGSYVTTALPLFSLVDDAHPWVEANFKETDLTYVRPGQPALIDVDTYPSHEWRAKVISVTPATGAEFSILPPQNASGNWVKVVQRIMVRLEFENYKGAPPLAAGMSANVDIDTRYRRISRMFGFGAE